MKVQFHLLTLILSLVSKLFFALFPTLTPYISIVRVYLYTSYYYYIIYNNIYIVVVGAVEKWKSGTKPDGDWDLAVENL